MYLAENGWWVGTWKIPISEGSSQYYNLSPDGTFGRKGTEGTIWVRLSDGAIDLRSDKAKTGYTLQLTDWDQASVDEGANQEYADRTNDGKYYNEMKTKI